jgi:hypothetical protein
MSLEHLALGTLWTWLLLAVVTAGIGALTVRTARAMVAGRFLPAPPALQQVPLVVPTDAVAVSAVTTRIERVETKEHVA